MTKTHMGCLMSALRLNVDKINNVQGLEFNVCHCICENVSTLKLLTVKMAEWSI